MTSKTTLAWIDGMSFEAEVDGHKLYIDLSEDKGGRNLGPRPKPLLLAALSGCSAMDVVSILKKMRVTDYTLKVDMEGDTTDEYPMPYHIIRMNFRLTGDSLPAENVIKAVEMSITKYCAVHDMLSKAAKIITTIYINEQEVWNA